MRATLSPASIRLRSASGEQLDGPSVQTIFVRQNDKSRAVRERSLPRGDEIASKRLRLLRQAGDQRVVGLLEAGETVD